jgi:heme A synthase
MRVLQYIQISLGSAFLIYGLVRGYARRRRYWNRASWLRFGTVCAASLVILTVSLGMTRAVEGMEPASLSERNQKAVWVVATVAVLLLGSGLLGGAVGWLAFGKADRPFPGAAREPSRSAPIDASSA